jgi:hypothetical protein
MEIGRKEGGQTVVKRIVAVIMMSLFVVGVSWADDKVVEKAEEIKASVIIPMKLEGLEWKLKCHQEKAISLQLRAMIQVWNQVEFQDLQKKIRQTEQEIKRLLILK